MQDAIPRFFKLSKTVANGLLSGELSESECARIPMLSCVGFHMECRIIHKGRQRFARVTLVETTTDDAVFSYDYSESLIAA